VAPFSVVKSEVVSFFIVKWPPNLMSIVRLKGNSGPKFDEKLVPNIIDKYTFLTFWGCRPCGLVENGTSRF